ncbi:Phosphatidylinositol 4-kinase pik1alpha (PI4-kinase)(PtdIns-4-kinase), partial [Spiromyces aspiralis]
MLLAQLARMQKGLGRSKQVYTTVAGESSTAASSSTSANNSDQAVGAPERKSRRRGGAHAQAADTVEKIRENLINEMMRLENKRFQLQQARLKAQREQQRQTPATAASKSDSSEGLTGMASDQVDLSAVEYKDDPSAKVLKEDWEQKKARIRTSSPYGHEPRWNLISVIVKEGADLRQEQLALQLIREMGRVWQLENVPVFIRYFRIMVTGEQSGLIETITNTISVHSLKKDFYNRNPDYTGPPFTLFEYFRAEYGEPDTPKYQKAQDNFMRSLVAYSLATYILQLRDRHNGNILLDTEGHLIHIDFGFMLSNSPGSVGFEAAPFKMPQEYVQVLGGMGSPKWREFKGLLRQAFMVLRKYVDNFCLLVEMMLKDSKLPCLSAGPAAVTTMRDRFQLTMTDKQVDEFLDRLLL